MPLASKMALSVVYFVAQCLSISVSRLDQLERVDFHLRCLSQVHPQTEVTGSRGGETRLGEAMYNAYRCSTEDPDEDWNTQALRKWKKTSTYPIISVVFLFVLTSPLLLTVEAKTNTTSATLPLRNPVHLNQAKFLIRTQYESSRGRKIWSPPNFDIHRQALRAQKLLSLSFFKWHSKSFWTLRLLVLNLDSEFILTMVSYRHRCQLYIPNNSIFILSLRLTTYASYIFRVIHILIVQKRLNKMNGIY